MLESFCTPVSQAGIPHFYRILELGEAKHFSLDKERNLLLKNTEVAQLYWLLKTVSFYFSFTVNANTFERSFTSTCLLAPKQRIAHAPTFVAECREKYRLYAFSFPLHYVYRIPGNPYYYKLFLKWTENTDPLFFYLCAHVCPDFVLLDTVTIPFLSTTLTFYLYGIGKQFSGKINDCRCTLEFYDYAQPESET
jgi:hypothetical protein